MKDHIITSQNSEPVNQEVHSAFIQFISDIESAGDVEALLIKASVINNLTIDKQKIILCQLALSGDCNALKFLKNAQRTLSTKELRQWAMIAYEQCRMELESELLGTDVTLVMTGLGGEGQKTRFVVVLSRCFGKPFSKAEQQCVAKNLKILPQHFDVLVEKNYCKGNFMQLTLLIDINVAPAEPIEWLLKICNEPLAFFRWHYLITNTSYPSPAEIDVYLQTAAENADFVSHLP